MKQIKILKSDIVGTIKGPFRVEVGQEISVDDEIAASLVGRGYAAYLNDEPNIKEGVEGIDYSSLKVAELRELATQAGIDHQGMNKTELVEALSNGDDA